MTMSANTAPPIFYCSWVPKGPEKSGGGRVSEGGSFSATGTIKVRTCVFFINCGS